MIKVTVIFHEGDVGREVAYCKDFAQMLAVIEFYGDNHDVITILCEDVNAV